MLVAGASGFVGRRLCMALDRAGHNVVAMTRNPAGYRGAGTPVRGDVQDPDTLEPVMAGCSRLAARPSPAPVCRGPGCRPVLVCLPYPAGFLVMATTSWPGHCQAPSASVGRRSRTPPAASNFTGPPEPSAAVPAPIGRPVSVLPCGVLPYWPPPPSAVTAESALNSVFSRYGRRSHGARPPAPGDGPAPGSAAGDGQQHPHPQAPRRKMPTCLWSLRRPREVHLLPALSGLTAPPRRRPANCTAGRRAPSGGTFRERQVRHVAVTAGPRAIRRRVYLSMSSKNAP